MKAFVIAFAFLACAAAFPATKVLQEEHGYYPPPPAAAPMQNYAAPMAYYPPEQPGYIKMEGFETLVGPSAPKKKPKFFPSKEDLKAKILQSLTEFKVGLTTLKEGLKSLIKLKKTKPEPAVAYATSYDVPANYAPANYAPTSYGYGSNAAY